MRSAGSMWARRDSAAAAGSSRRIGAGLLRRGQTSFGMLECMRRNRRVRPVLPPRSAFAGFRFPREVIVLAMRWYLRYGLSYRDVEELLAERGVHVNHVSIHRLVRRFTQSWPRLPAVPDTGSGPAGRSMKLTSRSPAVGDTSTGPWMRTAR
jgi:hypothetical protein